VVKELIRRIAATAGFRITRLRDANRFQAIPDCLSLLKERGYHPGIVIDGGANIGAFTQQAITLFPEAVFHLIEPQPACFGYLDALQKPGRIEVHKCALGHSAGTARLGISANNEVSTGAYVAADGWVPDHEAVVPVQPLDALPLRLEAGSRALLKLDLQGFELEALRGATVSLRSVEVVLCEVSFYAQAYEPSVLAVMSFLDQHGFDIHDIAALVGRGRDNRAHQGDLVFVKRGSALMLDTSWA
jgi:FkbM family methyltransferase